MEETPMKRVVILVPDSIVQVSGTRNNTSREDLQVDEESLVKVLGPRPDYHLDYYFDDIDRVRILTILDMPAKPEQNDDIQEDVILNEIASGKRMACTDGCCTGIIRKDGNCGTCGKPLSLSKINQIEKVKRIMVAIAAETGLDRNDLFGYVEK